MRLFRLFHIAETRRIDQLREDKPLGDRQLTIAPPEMQRARRALAGACLPLRRSRQCVERQVRLYELGTVYLPDETWPVKPTEPGTPEDEDAPGKIENITDPKENACGGTIEVSKSDILETFPLEKKELESVENGSDISLKLEVKDIAEEVKTSEDASGRDLQESYRGC